MTELIVPALVRRAHEGADAFVGAPVRRREEREAELGGVAGAGRDPPGRRRRAGAARGRPTRAGSASSATSTGSSTRGRGGGSPGKCQVFIAPEDDHLRTRLTHAVEVAQVATGIARAANLCLPLVEAIALAHDCGHGPAGHASEEAFSPYLPGTGYDHAVYGADVTLAPLNLCVETLDGVRNHSWRRPAPVHARGRGGGVGRPHRVRLPRLRGRGAGRASSSPTTCPPRCATSSAAGASEQVGTFVLAVLDAIDRTGHVGMTEPAASRARRRSARSTSSGSTCGPAARRQAERVDPPARRPRRPLRRRAAAHPARCATARSPAPVAGLARGGRARGALRERDDRPLRARPRRRAARLAARRSSPRRLSRADARGAASAVIASRPMGILDEDVARVRDATDLVALASEHLALEAGRAAASSASARSTPRRRRRSTSTPRWDVYYCFGCQAERRRDHVRARGRAPRLRRRGRAARGARRHHAALRRQGGRQGPQRASSASSRRSAAAIDVLPRSCCSSRADGGIARGYLRGRAASTATRSRQFQLGWSPDGWDRLSVHLQQQKFARDDIVDAGLAFVNKANKLQDQFRGRAHVPDLRRARRAGRLRRARARRRRPEVQELARDADLPEEPVALRAQLGEGRDRRRAARSSSARATPT